ncbi:MAG TPA: hypothetical protein VFN85_01900 [Solirubrobacterales bacterium]|nr:hypothetical protein [Solirubrobacterales bacterium]
MNPVNPIDLDTPESISRFVATEEALERQARREAREEHADARTEVVRAEGELIQARANSLNRSAEKRGAEADLLRFERVERIFLMVVNAIFAILLVTGVLVGAEFLGRVVAAAAAFNGLMGALRLIRTYRSDRGGDSPLKATGGQVPPP